MYVHTRTLQFVCHSCACECIEACVVYVPAWKCQFVHFRGPGAFTVDRVRYLYTRKEQFMFYAFRWSTFEVHEYAESTLQGISTLENTSLCFSMIRIRAQKTV